MLYVIDEASTGATFNEHTPSTEQASQSVSQLSGPEAAETESNTEWETESETTETEAGAETTTETEAEVTTEMATATSPLLAKDEIHLYEAFDQEQEEASQGQPFEDVIHSFLAAIGSPDAVLVEVDGELVAEEPHSSEWETDDEDQVVYLTAESGNISESSEQS